MCMCFITYQMSLLVLLVCNISVGKTQCGTGFIFLASVLHNCCALNSIVMCVPMKEVSKNSITGRIHILLRSK